FIEAQPIKPFHQFEIAVDASRRILVHRVKGRQKGAVAQRYSGRRRHGCSDPLRCELNGKQGSIQWARYGQPLIPMLTSRCKIHSMADASISHLIAYFHVRLDKQYMSPRAREETIVCDITDLPSTSILHSRHPPKRSRLLVWPVATHQHAIQSTLLAVIKVRARFMQRRAVIDNQQVALLILMRVTELRLSNLVC
ncbi:MAG: hypothetical protein ACI89J_003278, partial [Hyphomicrobiaceae bacterium]